MYSESSSRTSTALGLGLCLCLVIAAGFARAAAASPAASSAAAPNPSESDRTVVEDEHGRLARVETGRDVTRFEYDDSGALQAQDSSRFGRTEYSYVPGRSSGPFARIQSVRQISDRGIWERNVFHDQEGAVALKTEGLSPGFIRSVLRTLQPYFWPSTSGPLTPQSVGPVEGKGFASISVVADADGGEVQHTTVFGRELEISTRSQGDGELRIWDSLGAERSETWSGQNLVGARDQAGPILKARLDEFGRPERIAVGGSLLLQFDYVGGERRWVRRHVADLETGRILGSWNRADDFESLDEAALPRRGALAFLPGSIPIAEWDAEHSPGGTILISRKGDPYALIPLDEKGKTWHSISTSFDDVLTRDRIDYTDTRVRVHLSLGSASLAAGTEAVLVVERERNLDLSGSEEGEVAR